MGCGVVVQLERWCAELQMTRDILRSDELVASEAMEEVDSMTPVISINEVKEEDDKFKRIPESEDAEGRDELESDVRFSCRVIFNL